MLFHNMYASTSYKIQQEIISDVGNVYFLSYCFNWHVGFQEYNIAAHSQKNPWLPGMSIDFEVAGENWKVAGKLMRTATAGGLGVTQGPQKLWDKWCKILHSRLLLALNFIIETSFFLYYFSHIFSNCSR